MKPANRYLTHPAFRDVFLEVLNVGYSDADRVNAKIRLWHRSRYSLGFEPFYCTFPRSKWNELVPYEVR
jgi:hypothetical protein